MLSTRNGHHPKTPELISRERREIKKLNTLLEAGRILAENNNLKTAFAATLETLGRHHGMIRSFVMLLDSDSAKIRIEASYGLNQESAHRITYRIGEGVIGRVVQSGKPVVVPQTSREPLLLNRKTAFAATLKPLGRHHGMIRSFVMLLDSDSAKIRIEASYGLNQESAHRITYRIGEGVIGRVVQSGKPVVVPQTSREPLLLN